MRTVRNGSYGVAYPAVHCRYTEKQCTARQSPGGLPPLSLTTKSSWVHLGDVSQASRQRSDANIHTQ